MRKHPVNNIFKNPDVLNNCDLNTRKGNINSSLIGCLSSFIVIHNGGSPSFKRNFVKDDATNPLDLCVNRNVVSQYTIFGILLVFML